MSKYSEKKERQAKEALSAEQAEREAARAKAKAKEQKRSENSEKPTTPEKPTMRIEAIKERMELSAKMISTLETANDAIDACIKGAAEMKDETQGEERGFYYAAFGRLVSARDKVFSAINSLNLAMASGDWAVKNMEGKRQ